ncbi:unnamed protein product [Brassicogethes aeneus]|nr:unnamed protein product [Brassicogethes aeneus]
MLVVDRSVFAQLQAEQSGIDFMELSANLIRAQRHQTGSTPSILDSETTSKGLSPISLGLSPPAYDEIFGDKLPTDLPPSYSELSLMFRNYTRQMQGVEQYSLENLGDVGSDIEVNNENNINKELDDSSVILDIDGCVQDEQVKESRM